MTKSPGIFLFLLLLLLLLLPVSCDSREVAGILSPAPQADGRTIFNTLTMGGCTACHGDPGPGKIKMAGPELRGVSNLHTEEWIRRWLKNPEKVWRENDPETVGMKMRLGISQKPDPGMKIIGNISDADIEELIKYLKTL